MAYVIFGIFLVLFCAISAYLSYYFGQWKNQSILCTISYTIGWLISLCFIGILPLDISSTFLHQNYVSNITDSDPSSSIIFVDMTTLNVFWRLFYWMSQLLTWLILPIMESYAGSGEFTPLRKLRSAFIDNAIIYGTYLVIFIAAMIYLLIRKTIPFNLVALKVLLITTSNTWGLFLVILFLGYGLIEVPRSIFCTASHSNRLRFGYFTVSKRYLEFVEDEEELKTVLAEVHSLDRQVPSDHPLRHNLDVIVSKASNINRGSDVNQPPRTHSTDNGHVTIQQLVKLHKRLKKAFHHCSRARALWVESIRHAASVEDIHNNCTSGKRIFEHGDIPAILRVNDGATSTSWSSHPPWRRTLEWYWKCRMQPLVMRGLGGMLGVMSLLVLWSECTFFVRTPRLSVVAAILHNFVTSYNIIAFVSFLFLGYLGFCVYFTAYRLRFFNYYRLVPNHHSDAISLIFYGYMLCRLTPPLCVNFLCLAHLDSHVLLSSHEQQHPFPPTNSTTLTGIPLPVSSVFNASVAATTTTTATTYETAFTNFMGHLDVVGFIAGGFNVYFPMVALLLCVLTLLQLGSRILSWLGIPQIMDASTFGGGKKGICNIGGGGNSSAVDDAIEDGRMLLYRERTLGRTRRFGGDAKANRRRSAPRHEQNAATADAPVYSNAAFEDEASGRIDNIQPSHLGGEPAVEFSEDQVNAMFDFSIPRSGPPRYTPLDGEQHQRWAPAGENRPLLLVSKVTRSLQRLLRPTT